MTLATTTTTSSQPRTKSHGSDALLYHADPDFCSLVSSPRRCPLWGDARYRGNCDGTLFKELVHRYRPASVADPMVGSGTTRDVITGMAQYGQYRGRYWSADLRSGFDLVETPLPGRYEMVWIHPPYWDIIRYSDHPADLSGISDFRAFLGSLAACLRRCRESLVQGGMLAVLIGDVRRRGRYYCLAQHVMQLDGDIGDLSSVIIKAQHNCTSDRIRYAAMKHPPIKHEYCLLFANR